MLLLGGFTIAAALSKYDIAKLMATTVLNKAGTQPRIVLVSNMFVAMFASMWISNVAAPVLCFSLIEVFISFLMLSTVTLILFLAYASESSCRVKVPKAPDHWYCLGFKHWRHGFSHRLSTKYYRPSKHESATKLG